MKYCRCSILSVEREKKCVHWTYFSWLINMQLMSAFNNWFFCLLSNCQTKQLFQQTSNTTKIFIESLKKFVQFFDVHYNTYPPAIYIYTQYFLTCLLKNHVSINENWVNIVELFLYTLLVKQRVTKRIGVSPNLNFHILSNAAFYQSTQFFFYARMYKCIQCIQYKHFFLCFFPSSFLRKNTNFIHGT